MPLVAQTSVRPMRERLSLYFAKGASREREGGAAGNVAESDRPGCARGCGAWHRVCVSEDDGAACDGQRRGIPRHFRGARARRFCAWSSRCLLAALWTIPAGVVIGLNPRLSAVTQPIAQIAASVPATALFPIILLLLIRVGGGWGLARSCCCLLGTQWYILFNVIAGASAIPTDLKEVCGIFQFGKLEKWRQLLLPAIFPYLITGLVTASGGAWNASIVAEYFHFHGQDVFDGRPGRGDQQRDR